MMYKHIFVLIYLLLSGCSTYPGQANIMEVCSPNRTCTVQTYVPANIYVIDNIVKEIK